MNKFENLNMICKSCNGSMVGDGYTETLRCEHVILDLNNMPESDHNPIYCDLEDETYKKLKKLQKRFPDSGAWNPHEKHWRERLIKLWEDYDQEGDEACKDCLECIGFGQSCYCNVSYG